jgi:diguanylate cyclase (GGDEF)-like protein
MAATLRDQGLAATALDAKEAPSRRAAPNRKNVSPAAAEFAIRDLLQPNAIRLTVQPVTRLRDDAILVYEIRWRIPRLDVIPSLEEIWTAAKTADLLSELDDTLLRAELGVAARLSPGAVMLELHPWRCGRQDLFGLLASEVKAAGLDPGKIVWQMLERLESGPTYDMSAQLHERGFRVGLARVGAVRSRLAETGKVEPDVIEMDPVMIDGLDEDRGRRAMVSALVGYAAQMEAYLVAGGIAEKAALTTLIDLGVEFGYGPLIGGPFEAASELQLPGRVPLLSLDFPPPIDGDKPYDHGDVASSRRRVRNVPLHFQQLGVAEVLSEAARAFQTEHDPHAILELAADYLKQVVPFDALFIYEADWGAGQFRPILAHSFKDPGSSAAVMAYSFGLGTGLTGWAFDLGTPQRVNDAHAHPAAGHVPGTVNQDESMLLLPLISGDYRLGILNMVRFRRDAFVANELIVAGLVAHMAAAAWRNAQLFSEQVQHAITDSLTGLLNTRWLQDTARREVAMAERSGTELALLMIDLDDFKQINDSCGHAVGDGILHSVARALQRAVRAEDAAVRYGGEEFVLILPGCSREGSRRIARQIRKKLAEIPLPAASTLPAVTASIGIAFFPKHGRTISQLLGIADAAMYTAKRRGKNRVSVAR